jgi:glutaconate CoA-transferase, subunit A
MADADYKHKLNKIMTEKEAISTFLHDGDTFTVGGFLINRETDCVFREIARQGQKHLTYIEESATYSIDTLIGLGQIDRFDVAYFATKAGGIVGLPCLERCYTIGVPRPVNMGNFLQTENYKGNEPPMQVVDWSNFQVALRFVAGALNVPFMPNRSSFTTDLPKYNPEIKFIQDPYTNKPLHLIPACKPDVAFISVQRADRRGNGQVWGFTSTDVWKARAAKHVVLFTEELVTTEKIYENPSNTIVPAYCTDAVVHLPYNSHPFAVFGFYQTDTLCLVLNAVSKQTLDGFKKWSEEWNLGLSNHYDYCEKVGWENLDTLAKSAHTLGRIPS